VEPEALFFDWLQMATEAGIALSRRMDASNLEMASVGSEMNVDACTQDG
jgi:hypothetical protein